MKILVLSTSTSGTKTKKITRDFYDMIEANYGEEYELNYITLEDKQMVFSDGRNYLDYTGDTLDVATEIMQSDVIIFGAPIYQASIPASLKNVFDILPHRAFDRKVIGLIITGGSLRHYLVPETQIKPIIHYMQGVIIPKYIYAIDTDFKADGTMSDEIELRLEALLDEMVSVSETYQVIWQKQDDMFGF